MKFSNSFLIYCTQFPDLSNANDKKKKKKFYLLIIEFVNKNVQDIE